MNQNKILQNLNIPSLRHSQIIALKALEEHPYLYIQAKTGAGKTLIYVLNALAYLNEQPTCQVMVLVPTRELALQVSLTFKLAIGIEQIKIATCIGGQPIHIPENTQIIIGTVGRILDAIQQELISVDHLTTLILDEADMIYATGQHEAMLSISSYINPQKIIALSATNTNQIEQYFYPHDYYSLILDEQQLNQQIQAYYVLTTNKQQTLVDLLTHLPIQKAMIFVNHRFETTQLKTHLEKHHILVEAYSGLLEQSKRQNIMQEFKQGNIRVLIASDAAARGLDIPQVSHTIHYDPPIDIQTYIHRSGRSGHQEESGITISLIQEQNEVTNYIQLHAQPLTIPQDQRYTLDTPLPQKHSTTSICELYFPLGKKDKYRTRDFIGALCTYIPFEHIGNVIQNDHQTWITIQQTDFEKLPSTITIKGKKHTIQKRKKAI